MPIQVQTPDGNIAQFPDGMSDAQISAVLAKEFPAPKIAPPPKQPNTYADVVKSAGAGLGQGLAAYGGIVGDLGNVLGSGMRAIGIPTRDTSKSLPPTVTLPGGELGPAPSSADINAGIQSVTGKYHQPETVPGEYARTIASFAPAALAPGSAAARVLRVVGSGASSETAGQVARQVDPALEPVARLAGALAPTSIKSIAQAGLSGANRATAAVTGNGFLNPTTEAARRLAAAFEGDGGLDTALQRQASFQRSGASTPSVLDLGGGNVRRLVRASAGGGGPAETAALSYADQIRSNLQDNVASRAAQLTPEYQGSAASLGAEMERNQGQLATEQYRQPYAQPAAVTREMVSALQGPEGRGAINTAYATARANRDAQAMAELADLRDVAAAQSGGTNLATGRFQTLDDALANLSAGSLDRVRIAMREQAGALAASGRRGMARGYYGRVNDIDTALDQTPGLGVARDSYRQMQAGRDSLDVGSQVLNARSADYAGQVADLANRGASARLGPPNLGPGLRVGARDAIIGAVEAPTAGATGVLNRIGTSNRATANLATTFGAQAGGQFQEAVRNEVARLRNANFISPETGSQTQLRSADESLLAGIPTSLHSLASRIADKVFRGTQLTSQEREQIVKLGLSEADVRRFVTQTPRVNRGAVNSALAVQSQANGQ